MEDSLFCKNCSNSYDLDKNGLILLSCSHPICKNCLEIGSDP